MLANGPTAMEITAVGELLVAGAEMEAAVDTTGDVAIDFDGLAPEFGVRKWLLAKAEESGAPIFFLMLVEDVVGDLLDVMG